jgi:hypothetical protein
MKKTACFLLVAALLLSFCLSSCGSNECELFRYTSGDYEYVGCIDIDPFTTKPEKERECNYYMYKNGERGRSTPVKVIASVSSDIPDSQKDEDGVSYTVFLDDLGFVKYRYDFEKKSWVVP